MDPSLWPGDMDSTMGNVGGRKPLKTENFSAMLNEIKEQPELIAALLAKREEITKDFVRLVTARPIKRVYLTGSGSPFYAANALKHAAVKLLGVETSAAPAALFNNHERFNTDVYQPDEMLLICPAESGMGKRQVDAARKAKEVGDSGGFHHLESRWHSGYGKRYHPGEDLSPGSGAGYYQGSFHGAILLLLCFVDAARTLGRLTREEYDGYLAAFSRVPHSMASAIDNILAWFDRYGDVVMACPVYRVIAYGANLGTAEEAALKFLECHRRPSLFYELEECLQGPIRAVRGDDVIFLLCAEEGKEKERMLKLYEVMKEYTDYCFLVQSNADKLIDPQGIAFDTGNHEFINTMEFLVPMQILAYKIA